MPTERERKIIKKLHLTIFSSSVISLVTLLSYNILCIIVVNANLIATKCKLLSRWKKYIINLFIFNSLINLHLTHKEEKFNDDSTSICAASGFVYEYCCYFELDWAFVDVINEGLRCNWEVRALKDPNA